MSVKTKEEKPSTSLVSCCQSTSTTPDNSIVDYIEEDVETPNNNTVYHAAQKSGNGEKNGAGDQLAIEPFSKQSPLDTVEFHFPKRPKVDVEFQNLRYTAKQFSMNTRRFGE